MFGTMYNTLEKMFLPARLARTSQRIAVFAKTGGLRDLSLSVGSTDAYSLARFFEYQTQEQKCIVRPKTVCSSLNIVLWPVMGSTIQND